MVWNGKVRLVIRTGETWSGSNGLACRTGLDGNVLVGIDGACRLVEPDSSWCGLSSTREDVARNGLV